MRVAVAPGTPLADVRRRVIGRGFWLPALSTAGVSTATSGRGRATATAGTPAHTKGAWVEAIASTSQDASLLTVGLAVATTINSGNSAALLDIGIGGSGSETVLVSNLAIGCRQASDRYEIPLTIPSGSRISVRTQHFTALTTTVVQLTLGRLAFGRRSPNHIVTMGANTSVSHGVGLALATVNTKSAWTELVASTAEPFGALILGEQTNDDTSFVATSALLDVGVGPAGNEVVVIADFAYESSTQEGWNPMSSRILPVDIPAGSRLSARLAISSATLAMDLIIYGVPRQ